ncbi:MAG: hypothetical protein KJN90_04285 [Gammaproteobacteria bacterium]|nr:hypothetical protein [Gammaproteobacteria bacterium]
MKKILIGLIVILVIVVGGVFYAFDSLLKGGIESAGSSVLQTDVTVGSVGVSPLSGSGGIQQLRIGNPQGFNEPYAMELGGLDVAIDTSSVFSDVIVIDRIIIEQPVITYETRITTDNIRALLANIGGGSSGQPSEEAAGSGKRVIIRDFQMLGPQVRVASAIGSADVTIPDLRLQDIGDENAAVTVAEAGRQIFAALNERLLQADLPNVEMLRERVDQEVQELRDQAEEQVEELEERLEDEVENLQDRVRSLL